MSASNWKLTVRPGQGDEKLGSTRQGDIAMADVFGTDSPETLDIIYNGATGALFYDADGNSAGAAVQFAALSSGLALTSNKFFIV